jgi:hypothetical protein
VIAPRHPDLSQAIWRKSSHSSSTGQNCVEVATNLPGMVAIRDSQDSDGPKLLISAATWQHFMSAVKQTIRQPSHG